jgi:hypothetical protein
VTDIPQFHTLGLSVISVLISSLLQVTEGRVRPLKHFKILKTREHSTWFLRVLMIKTYRAKCLENTAVNSLIPGVG